MSKPDFRESDAFPAVLRPLDASPADLAVQTLRQAALITCAESFFSAKCHSVTSSYGGCYNYIDCLHMDVPKDPNSSCPAEIIARTAKAIKFTTALDLQAEVDTMLYVRAHTTIPVPRLYGYYCKEGEQQYIFMEFMQGEVVQGSPNLHKPEVMQRTARELARIVFELSQLRFTAIGSLRVRDTSSWAVELGPWSSLESTIHDSHLGTLCRGPWFSASAWLQAILQRRIVEANCEQIHDELLDEWFHPDIYGADYPGRNCFKRAQGVYPRLSPFISFHSGEDDVELGAARNIFCLCHGDLNSTNIMIQPNGPDAGKIVAVIDWELASVYPIWHAHRQGFDFWFDESCAQAYAAEVRRLEEYSGADDVLSESIARGRHCRHFATILYVEVRDIKHAESWLEAHGNVACRECCPVDFLEV